MELDKLIKIAKELLDIDYMLDQLRINLNVTLYFIQDIARKNKSENKLNKDEKLTMEKQIKKLIDNYEEFNKDGVINRITELQKELLLVGIDRKENKK